MCACGQACHREFHQKQQGQQTPQRQQQGPYDPSLDGALHGEFSPAWNGSELSVSSLKPSGGGDALQLHPAGDASRLSQNDASIDLPLSWSPDGTSLAVRAVVGATPGQAQESHVELIDAAGDRARVSDGADVLIVGWIQ